MSSPTVFLVLSSATIGGAEKRFAGLWADLKKRGDTTTTLVIPRSLMELMTRSADLQGIEDYVSQAIITDDADATPRGHLFRTLARLRIGHPDAVFHFTLLPPVLTGLFRPDRTVFTVPNSSLQKYNWKGLAPVLASVALSRRTDVLDESVGKLLGRMIPLRRSAISVTPNSFVDLDVYKPADEKHPRLVFTGLFSVEKQIDRLVSCLPELDAALKTGGVRAPEFRLLGRETRSPGVADACAQLQGIDVRAWFEPNPLEVLAGARVFFSLQRANNYPSKALLEAMASGCLPIVTDVGTTRRIASPEFAYFVPREFEARDLIGPALAILTMPEDEFRRRVALMRAFLAERFSIATMRSYYQDLWRTAAS